MQSLLQIFALVDFFALLGATFLFRSGLFYLLYAEFRPIILVQPVYILLTVFLGMARIVRELSRRLQEARVVVYLSFVFVLTGRIT